ncbi:MAG: nucleotidyltransferase domain-containing protein [Nanoarchaeota archaeon]
MIKNELKDKVTYCFIYGSFAKGTEQRSSDIDLFVVSEIKEDELIHIIQKLEHTVKREINYVLWNSKTFNQRAENHHLLKNIKESNIIMLIGNEDEFRRQIK